MEKVKSLLEKARKQAGELSPAAKIAMCVFGVTIVVGLALAGALRYVVALAILAVVFIISPPTPPPVWPPEMLLQAVALSMYYVFRTSARQLSALPPTYQQEIVHDPTYRVIGDAVVCTFDIYKQSTGHADPDELHSLAGVLHSRLVRHFYSTNDILWEWRANGGIEPWVQVTGIDDEGATLAVRVVLGYDERTIQGGQAYINELHRSKGALRTKRAARPATDTPFIPLAYDNALLQSGVQRAALWKYQQAAHMVVFGSTGSGKTYFVKQLIGNTLKYVSQSKVMVCDFKADDFRFLSGCHGYYAYTDCARGLEDFYKVFETRQMGQDTSRDFCILIFDEWAAYLSTLDKKTADNEIKKLSTLLMMGRSFECHVVISQQRADAQYFSTARDNFNVVVALGNLSNESRDMFFRSFKDEMSADQECGTGYMLTNGTDLTPIRTETVNMEKLERYILRHMAENKPPDGAGEA